MNFRLLILLVSCLAIIACDDETSSDTEMGGIMVRRGGETAGTEDPAGMSAGVVAGQTAGEAGAQAGDSSGGTAPVGCQTEPRFSALGPYAVGFKQINSGEDVIAIWYPASEGSQEGQTPVSYDLREWLPEDVAANIPDDGAPRFEMNAYADLPIAEGPFPVLLFAHGLAGYRLQSSQLMSHLASWGFIVTSAENDGIHLPVILGGGVPAGDRGPDLMRATLELLPTWNEAGGPLAGSVDLSRMGAFGHSMGTATVVNVAADDSIDVWVALAGAGFGPGPQKPFMIIGGTTDQLAAPPQVQAAFEAQTAETRRKLLIEGAGHLAFSDICLISREEGGLIAVASTYGLEVPMLIQMLAQDGCRPSDLPPEEAWPVIHHFVTAHFKETLSDEGSLDDFSEETRSCFEQINDYQEGAGDAPVGGAEMPGGMMVGGAETGGMMVGGAETGGMSGGSMTGGESTGGTTREPGVPGEVTCGDAVCDINANTCCLGITGDATCMPGDCAIGTAPQACDGPEDCGGAQRCCVSFPAGASCQDSCDGFGSVPLCHLDSECPDQEVCLDCDYPGGSRVSICGELGSTPPGSMGCDDRGPREGGAPEAGTEMAGTEMAGTEMAGTEMAGTEMAGTETLPEGQLGVEEEGVIACGNVSCDLSANSCCVSFLGLACQEGVDSCAFSVSQICDGPEECGGDSCCVTAGFPAEYACNNDCAGAVICHADADCGAGEVCSLCTYPFGPVAVCHLPGENALGSFGCE